MSNMCTYDASEVIVVVSAKPISSGRDAGDFLTLSTDTDEYTKSVGIQYVALNRGNDPSANAALTLMKTSLDNDFLAGLATLDRQTPGGIVFPFFIKHVSGTTLVVAEKAKIVRTPLSSASWGQEVGTYQWGFVLGNIAQWFGGMLAPTPTVTGATP